MKYYLGCSDWSCDEWKGPFYLEGLDNKYWFVYYSQIFDFVEIDSTFYRIPSKFIAMISRNNRKIWTIIDSYSSKTDEKEKMKAINLIIQCDKMKFEMIKSEPELINHKRYMKDLPFMIYNYKINYCVSKL
ncbi:MAG: DUF72 domain-containing protein [Deltaproteobacteria bacterium]